jgi:hypothetical protein
MSQVLKNLQLVTQSYSGTPNTGTGALFASGNVLYFENAASTTFPLGLTGGGSGYVIIREYTGSAPGGGTLTPTWNNNSSIKYIQVICVGAGGGGGGNNARNQSTNMRGGSGGGGGAIAWGFFDSASLTQASYPISIGAGGAGGAAVALQTNVGNNGSAGGYTTFGGTMVSASGGSGGAGATSTSGTSTAATGGLAINCLPGPGFAINGGPGAVGTTSVTSPNASSSFSNPLIPIGTSGGGASWSLGSDGSVRSGSLGGSGFEWNTLKSNNTISSNSGSNNLVTATVLLQSTSSAFLATTYGLGGGGNGALTTAVAFNVSGSGGNGGLYGAGGAGSSPLYTSATGGNRFGSPGGSGSSGLCIVVEYY